MKNITNKQYDLLDILYGIYIVSPMIVGVMLVMYSISIPNQDPSGWLMLVGGVMLLLSIIKE